MHDRRINGDAHVFGNGGGLYLRAMTWWDHETQSIWSQPVGEALAGPLRGARLDLLPSQVTTWANWQLAHPQTFVMVNDLDRLGSRRQGFQPDFVIGLVMGGNARAYYYDDVESAEVLNDSFADVPVVLWAANGDFRAYFSEIRGQRLTFSLVDGHLIDGETGTTWEIFNGLGVSGPLQGEALQPVPSLTAYDWAWRDFYSETEFYGK